ncbi:MAG: SPOR domain-containing protein [Marinifilaceae bacterium]
MKKYQLYVILFSLLSFSCNQEVNNGKRNETPHNVERVAPEPSSQPKTSESSTGQKTTPIIAGINFHVIAASYNVKNQAEQLRKQLYRKGYPSKVLYNKGRYRVTLVSFPQKEEALHELKRLRKLNRKPDLWLLRQ